jgi:hypothetical protein
MSLLSAASPFNSDNTPRKRVSTMKQSLNKYERQLEEQIEEPMQNLEPATIEDSQNISNNRKGVIDNLLNNMSNVSPDNDGTKLGNFNPPSYPVINQLKPPPQFNYNKNEMSPDELKPKNQLQIPATVIPNKVGNYSATENSSAVYSDYNNSYGNIAKNDYTPYYAKMGITGSLDDKMIEKLNYMIHLLEEQKNEKTNFVNEEFFLYTFLGIFMIFIVDSFSKAHKYTR